MPRGDEIRDGQRAAWAGLSAGWEKWDSVIMAQLGPVGTAMIERIGLAGDQRHLDIAAGTGEPGLTVAKFAPRGYMFFPDLAGATAEVARVLKPGGRLCSSVWVKPDENPWTTIAMQAIAAAGCSCTGAGSLPGRLASGADRRGC